MEEVNYTKTLIKKQTGWWKCIFDVQAPYRWHLKSLKPGFTLEIGCGIGRNLLHLKGNAVGIDSNLHSVNYARSRKVIAFTPEDFISSRFNTPGMFDSILLSHVAEHMTVKQTVELLGRYVHLLRPNGLLIIITPQEAGFKHDSTHIEFMDFAKLRKVSEQLRFTVLKEYSFPFPRCFGRFFIYNEFVFISRRTY